MGLPGWLLCKGLILSQKIDGQVVDPDLLAGRPPRWAISLFYLAAGLFTLPFAVWLLFQVLPHQMVFEMGDALRRSIWTSMPLTWLRYCGSSCRDLVFGMAVLPITWVAGVAGAIFWYRITKKRLEYQENQLRRQPNPLEALAGVDVEAQAYRRRPHLFVAFVLVTIGMYWLLPQLAADLRYYPDGRTAVFTTWRFGILCALWGLTTALAGHLAFLIQRIVKQRAAGSAREAG